MQAKLGSIELKVGDVIVLATDGVWDNFAADLNAATRSDSVKLARRHYA